MKKLKNVIKEVYSFLFNDEEILDKFDEKIKKEPSVCKRKL